MIHCKEITFFLRKKIYFIKSSNKDIAKNVVILDENYSHKFRLIKIISYHEMDNKVFALMQSLKQ